MKKRLVSFLFIACLSISIYGCGGKTDSEKVSEVDSDSAIESVVDGTDESDLENAIDSNQENADYAIESEIEGNEELVQESDNGSESLATDAVQWIKDQGLDAPDIVIWDEGTCTGIVVEDGEKYEVDESKKILLVGVLDSIMVDPDESLSFEKFYENYEEHSTKYVSVKSNAQGETDFKIQIKAGGQTYQRNFTFVYTDALN